MKDLDETRAPPATAGLVPQQELRGDYRHTAWDGDSSAEARGGLEIRYPQSSSRGLAGCRGRILALPYLPPGPGAERDPPRQGAHVPQALGCCASQHLETPRPCRAPAPHLHLRPVTMFRKGKSQEGPGCCRGRERGQGGNLCRC